VKSAVKHCIGLCLAGLALGLSTRAATADDAPAQKSPPAAVRQFRDCAAFQDRGVYDLAADEWERFLEQFPQDPLAAKAHHYLGMCRLLLKQYDAAAADFKFTIETYPKSELADASYLNLGLTQYSLAQAGQAAAYDEAIATFSALVAKFPQSKQVAEALHYLGESLYARGKKEAAARAYTELIVKHPSSPLRPDALYALGVTRQELGQHAEAGQTFDQFGKEFPKHPLRAEIVMRRAETSLSQGQFAEAAALYATVPEVFPESKYGPQAMLAAGNCFRRAGNLEAAEKWLTATLSSGGETNPEAAHWLARVKLKQQKPGDALTIVQDALPQSKGSSFAVDLLTDQADAVYDLDGRRGEAIGLYAAIAKNHPEHPLAPHALYRAALAALDQADYPSAKSYSEQYLHAYPSQPLAADAGWIGAEAALQLKQYDRAEKLYSQLVEENPAHADAGAWKLRRGLALLMQKKYSEVVATLVALAPELKSPDLVAQSQFLLGSAFHELQQHEPALRAFQASLAARPQGKQADETLLALAAVYRQLDNLPEATATLRRLLAEFPQSKFLDRATVQLGEYAAAMGDFDAAADYYRRVPQNWPHSALVANAQYGLASTQISRKDYSAAVQTLGALIDAHPQDAVAAKARYARALARERLQDYDAAQADLTAFLATNPPARERLDALYVEGLCAAGSKQYAKAAEIFGAILSADPKFPSADKVLYQMAWSLKSADRPDESLSAFHRLASEHPDSPLAAESLFRQGEHFYEAAHYAAAVANYQAALAKHPPAELGEKAAHKLGWSYFKSGQFERAQAAFESQVAAQPRGALAADAQFMVAESLFGWKHFEAAHRAYQTSFEQLPGNREFQALAHLHAAQTAAELKAWAESLDLLDKGLNDFPESALRGDMLVEAGWAQQNLGKPDEAVKLFERTIAHSDREPAARARFMIGKIFFEKKEYKEAVRHFFKVAYGYGYPQAAESIRVWQAQAAYEAGRCFEALNRADQAKKSYREVVDRYPQSDQAPLAKSRLQALGA
jgi:cellulose synthase operon protein C